MAPTRPLLFGALDNNVNRSYGLLKIRVTKDVSTSIYMQIAVVIAILFSMFFHFHFSPCVFPIALFVQLLIAAAVELGAWSLHFRP